jgi:hypothetical protein
MRLSETRTLVYMQNNHTVIPEQGKNAKATSGDETIQGSCRGADEGAGLNMN